MDEYVSKSAVQQMLHEAYADDVLSTKDGCRALYKRLNDMPASDVQSKDRVAELESLLEACEREFNYLLDCEIDNSSTRHHVAPLLDQVQLRVSGDIIRSLCKRCNGHKCLICRKVM